MILCHGDPVGFELILKEVERNKLRLVENEKQTYSFDHAFIGLALFDSWNIDSEIRQAVFSHHEEGASMPASWRRFSDLADYLSFCAYLGFYGDPLAPSADTLVTFGCGDEASLKATLKEVREAFDVESALFQKV